MENLTVLYEDNQIVVVVKPQNIPSQADGSGDKDMLTMVKEYIREKYNKPGEAFIGLVHRLDRPTGGIMVFARNSKAASRLTAQFKSKEVKKTYLAVTSAIPPAKQGHLCHYLKKDEKENIVKIVPLSEEGAKRAELDYKVLEIGKDNALVQVNPLTGRGHQIRVQFAGINCPLVGDNKYGKGRVMSTGLGLWACKLEFTHPTTKERMVFKIPPVGKVWEQFNISKYFLR